MCLTVTGNRTYREKDKPIIAYKVFRRVKKSGRIRSLYYQAKGTSKVGYKFGKVYKGHELDGLPAALNLHVAKVDDEKYNLGFHCFKTKTAARQYMKQWGANLPEFVAKVKLWGIITYGEQGGWDCVVGQFMKIEGEV